jgi:release factor glutamine methyltransferase
MDAINTIINSANAYLKPQGYLFIEHGFSQGERVRESMTKAGYHAARIYLDLAGHERVTACMK